MKNTFDELLQMIIGEPSENFIDVEEVDFQGVRDSSCKEFSEDEDGGTYYNAQEEMSMEALF